MTIFHVTLFVSFCFEDQDLKVLVLVKVGRRISNELNKSVSYIFNLRGRTIHNMVIYIFGDCKINNSLKVKNTWK